MDSSCDNTNLPLIDGCNFISCDENPFSSSVNLLESLYCHHRLASSFCKFFDHYCRSNIVFGNFDDYLFIVDSNVRHFVDISFDLSSDIDKADLSILGIMSNLLVDNADDLCNFVGDMTHVEVDMATILPVNDNFALVLAEDPSFVDILVNHHFVSIDFFNLNVGNFSGAAYHNSYDIKAYFIHNDYVKNSSSFFDNNFNLILEDFDKINLFEELYLIDNFNCIDLLVGSYFSGCNSFILCKVYFL